MKWVEWLYKGLNILVLAGLLLSCLAAFIDPRIFWPIAFFGISFTVWFVSALLMLIWGLFIRKKHLLFMAIALMLSAPMANRSLAFNSKSVNITPSLRLVSFNAKSFNSQKQNKVEADTLIKTLKADVVVIQEWRRTMGMLTSKSHPHHAEFMHGINSGVHVVSRFPILKKMKIDLKHSESDAGWVDIKIDNDTIRIYALHLESNMLSSDDYHKIKELEINDEYKSHATGMMKRMKKAMQKRADQVEIVAKNIKDCHHPVFICSDLNDTPQSFAYQQLKKGKKDAFIEAGSGWDGTFVKPFPFLRIDYILFSHEFDCVEYKSIRQHYSDHKLIFASFNLHNN